MSHPEFFHENGADDLIPRSKLVIKQIGVSSKIRMTHASYIRLYSEIICMELNYLLQQAFVLHQSLS